MTETTTIRFPSFRNATLYLLRKQPSISYDFICEFVREKVASGEIVIGKK